MQRSDAGKLARIGLVEKRRLARDGRAAMKIVLRAKRKIEESFYAMGRALATLKQSAVFHALGFASFGALCDALGVSIGQADRLVHIVQAFPASAAKHLTTTKATAIVKLASAIGGKTTPKGLLAQGTIHLSDGDAIDVLSANATRIDAVARKLAAHKRKPKRGGVVVSSAARAFFARLERERRAEKIPTVRVESIAASKKTGGKMRITANVGDAKKLGHALIRAAGG